MKTKRNLLMLLCIAFSLTACGVSEKASSDTVNQIAENSEQSEDVDAENEVAKLSFESLKNLVNDTNWNENCRNSSVSDWKKYEYIIDETFDEIHINMDNDFDLVITPLDKGTAVDTIWLSNIKAGEAICLYSYDGSMPVNLDIDTFVKKEYMFADFIEKMMPESSILDSPIRLGSQYTELGFLNFNVKLWESNDYVEPKHGEFAPNAWYALGGIGECAGEFEDYAVFSDGNLVGYNYVGNHMDAEFVKKIQTSDYSGCLYKYHIDLFTASEAADESILSEDETTIAYYVLFFTNGDNIYMEYFNCDYFTENEVIDTLK
jgi:hypothetical protein